ncbi:MAG: ABC transporter ATP-binding protein [Candidatus Heimdallarchaeota archaeon]|nr:MAG: ABC transporter ATP-binding protein [Candidatus Heimdallarchaeota archaeon]
MPTIEVRNISKTFEDSIAILDISFKLEDGELITLLGPSGSGKTTVLRLIAGLIESDTGEILFDEVDISNVPTEDRNIGFVFQSYALFPHLTVAENIAFGLETRRWPKEKIISRVIEMLELVGLEGKGKRYPRELSGGEKSRVALARALAPEPSLLLLDEPLSALDMSLKESLRDVIREIQQKVQVSTIYVTHDQKEAMEVSDRIIILNNGQIVESGTPQELYLDPKKQFTAEFLGVTNLLEGTLKKKKGQFLFETSFGILEILAPIYPINTEGILAIFPEHINVSYKKMNHTNEFPATIKKSSFGGPYIDLIVTVNSTDLEVQITSSMIEKLPKKGQKVFISIPKENVLFLEN